jgi:hypothetical protein
MKTSVKVVAGTLVVAVGAQQVGATVNDPGDKNGGLNIPIAAFNALTATTTGAQNVAIGAVALADTMTDEVRYPFPPFTRTPMAQR